ncbi:MAG: amino-acid N-acetyltransferase [Gammaproteobacteria bacterium]|nr:amino-acid N-acetyltransferase [Gammaproteobacteria bacterium]
MREKQQQLAFVDWFRQSSPYIRAFRGRTFVITFGGEMLADAQFPSLVHDLALLNNLGIRLVLVHGARPQIDKQLKQLGAEITIMNGLRVTDIAALECVKQAAGAVRVEIEAQLSMGLSATPLAKCPIKVVSGNFVTAMPLGIRDGVDYLHTGEIRKIDTDAIRGHLQQENIVLLSPMGYSPTGEVFNLTAEAVATEAAKQLKADKLIMLTDMDGIPGSNRNIIRELTQREAQSILEGKRKLKDPIRQTLAHAVSACLGGVSRVHLINRHTDGGLLLELFTRDGIGSLISSASFEDVRRATIDDVGGILDLISPLEQEGILVRRSRELLEIEIDYFSVIERDGLIVACAALYPYPDDAVGELACLAVHTEYRNEGRGDELFQFIIKQARAMGVMKLFVLTTRTAHWFRERGFKPANIDALPVKKRQLYNYQRNSKVFIKDLSS